MLKADWEGGIVSYIIDYGVDTSLWKRTGLEPLTEEVEAFQEAWSNLYAKLVNIGAYDLLEEGE